MSWRKNEKYRAKAREYARQRRLRLIANPLTCDITEKACGICGLVKKVAEFRRSMMNAHGLLPNCRQCHKEKCHIYRTNPVGEKWASGLLGSAKSGASKRGIPVSITLEDILRMFKEQGGRCYWFDVPMVPTVQRRHAQKPSIDRLDPKKGYTPDNCVLACWAANAGRLNVDADTFRTFCDLIKSHCRPA